MMEFKLTIEAPALEEAINNLAASLGGKCECASHTQQPVMTETARPVAPTPAPAPEPKAAAPTPAPAPAQKTYSRDDIMRAASNFVDERGVKSMADIQAIIQKYGVQAVTQLSDEHLASFAADLAALGAKLDGGM